VSRGPTRQSNESAMTAAVSTPAWEMIEITKRFAGVVANDCVSLKLRAGEIHGLLGENGSGKSTLIKILAGAQQPTSGQILKNGSPVVLHSPIAAREAGVATVFQEFSLVPTLTVAENVFLGRWPRRGATVDWRAMREGARRALSDMEVHVDPEAVVASLSVAEQQLVEIAKAFAADATMLILDEPTTALGLSEIARLHDLLRRLKARGVAILYISHRLDEVVELVDVVTILKDGRVAASSDQAEVSIPFIVRAMVGEVEEHYPKGLNATDEVVLDVRGLTTAKGVENVTFDVRRGEVLGLGGVLGSGRTEIARALFGVDRIESGEVRWRGRRVAFANPAEAIRAGFALVPENRKFDGLFFNFTGPPNLTAAALDKLGGFGRLFPGREARESRRLIADLAVTPAAEFKEVGFLSGGNQQKIVIGRWLFAGATLFILDEPTQGIDIGAKIAVYRLVNRLTASGCSVILISSDHEELLAISDRIAIVSHGTIVDVRPAGAVSKEALVRASAQATVRAA
jgi:ABC-type sugar transport system ATPase subunit